MRNLKAECRADPDSLAGDRLHQRFCETSFRGKEGGEGRAPLPTAPLSLFSKATLGNPTENREVLVYASTVTEGRNRKECEIWTKKAQQRAQNHQKPPKAEAPADVTEQDCGMLGRDPCVWGRAWLHAGSRTISSRSLWATEPAPMCHLTLWAFPSKWNCSLFGDFPGASGDLHQGVWNAFSHLSKSFLPMSPP